MGFLPTRSLSIRSPCFPGQIFWLIGNKSTVPVNTCRHCTSVGGLESPACTHGIIFATFHLALSLYLPSVVLPYCPATDLAGSAVLLNSKYQESSSNIFTIAHNVGKNPSTVSRRRPHPPLSSSVPDSHFLDFSDAYIQAMEWGVGMEGVMDSNN